MRLLARDMPMRIVAVMVMVMVRGVAVDLDWRRTVIVTIRRMDVGEWCRGTTRYQRYDQEQERQSLGH